MKKLLLFGIIGILVVSCEDPYAHVEELNSYFNDSRVIAIDTITRNQVTLGHVTIEECPDMAEFDQRTARYQEVIKPIIEEYKQEVIWYARKHMQIYKDTALTYCEEGMELEYEGYATIGPDTYRFVEKEIRLTAFGISTYITFRGVSEFSCLQEVEDAGLHPDVNWKWRFQFSSNDGWSIEDFFCDGIMPFSNKCNCTNEKSHYLEYSHKDDLDIFGDPRLYRWSYPAFCDGEPAQKNRTETFLEIAKARRRHAAFMFYVMDKIANN